LLLEGNARGGDRDDAVVLTDRPRPARTALVLSMTGPAHLLEVVAPDRAGRKVDHTAP